MSVYCNLKYIREEYKTIALFTEDKLNSAILSSTILNKNIELNAINENKANFICKIFEAVAVIESRYDALLYGRPLSVEIVVD